MTKTAHIVLGAPSEEALFPAPEEGDTVIGVDRGAFECLKRGIPMTMAVGDFDSVSPSEKARLQSAVKSFHEYESDKDDTDAELALTLAMKENTGQRIKLYNWAGGRIDHLWSVLYLVCQPRFNKIIGQLALYNETNTITFYKPGSYTLLKEDSRKYLSFIGLTPLEDLTLENVKYPLTSQSFAYPRALVSNEFLTGDCKLSFSKGILAVVQSSEK